MPLGRAIPWGATRGCRAPILDGLAIKGQAWQTAPVLDATPALPVVYLPRRTDVVPNRPCGRVHSTATRIMNATASFRPEEM